MHWESQSALLETLQGTLKHSKKIKEGNVEDQLLKEDPKCCWMRNRIEPEKGGLNY